MSKLNIRQPVIWSFVPTSAPIIQQLTYGLVVFDAVDNWLKHRSYQLHAVAVRSGYELFSQIAHCIFTVNLHNSSLFRGRDDVLHVPNGVAVGRYEQQYPVPIALAKLRRPIIGYIGTIQDRIDISLIQELARQNIGSVVLIGRVWYRGLANQLAQLPNTHLLGQVPRNNAPSFISNFTVGIVPHKQDDFVASTEALKVYEYLAAGIPVVATTSHEFGNLSEFVSEVATPASFADAVRVAIAGDNETLRQRRRAAVMDCDWSARVEMMMAVIRAKLESA
jgi:glycosyltransferase involved in cell wall biosynthesis